MNLIGVFVEVVVVMVGLVLVEVVEVIAQAQYLLVAEEEQMEL